MDRYEYRWAIWRSGDNGAAALTELNALGSDGWEAVGLTDRAVVIPAAGMGAAAVPEVAVLSCDGSRRPDHAATMITPARVSGGGGPCSKSSSGSSRQVSPNCEAR